MGWGESIRRGNRVGNIWGFEIKFILFLVGFLEVDFEIRFWLKVFYLEYD